MSITKFPADSVRKQRAQIKDCCKSNLQDWDCGCSWGCTLCYVRYHCKECGASYGAEVAKELKEQS